MSDERDDRFWNEQIKNGKSRPTQEPLQVIEGLDEALATPIVCVDTFKEDANNANIIYKAAKAYQQALEKQEK